MERYQRRGSSRSRGQDSVMKNYSRFLTGARTGEDGLTYKESTYSARSSAWTTFEPLPVPWDLVIEDDRPDGIGAHSLQYLARKALNENLHLLGLDALQVTPYHPWGFWIWTDAVVTRKDTFPVWRVFATAYPKESKAFGNRHYELPASGRLPPVISAVNSSTFAWLVKLRLSLSPAIVDSDLRTLPNLVNLEGLYIAPGPNAEAVVDDGLVRSWCRAAKHRACFQKLTMLSLYRFQGITANVLEYASWLPELRWLDLSKCHRSVYSLGPEAVWEWLGKEEWTMERRGWKEKMAGRACPLVKITLGLYTKVKESDATFVRRRMKVPAAVEQTSGKRKTEEGSHRAGAVVRRQRMKGMGDLLAEFQNPPKRR